MYKNPEAHSHLMRFSTAQLYNNTKKQIEARTKSFKTDLSKRKETGLFSCRLQPVRPFTIFNHIHQYCFQNQYAQTHTNIQTHMHPHTYATTPHTLISHAYTQLGTNTLALNTHTHTHTHSHSLTLTHTHTHTHITRLSLRCQQTHNSSL